MQIFERRFEMDYPVIDIEGTGTHIRDLIRESGHFVAEVSEYLGTSTSLVYRYIRGEVLPSIELQNRMIGTFLDWHFYTPHRVLYYNYTR